MLWDRLKHQNIVFPAPMYSRWPIHEFCSPWNTAKWYTVRCIDIISIMSSFATTSLSHVEILRKREGKNISGSNGRGWCVDDHEDDPWPSLYLHVLAGSVSQYEHDGNWCRYIFRAWWRAMLILTVRVRIAWSANVWAIYYDYRFWWKTRI